MATSYSSNFVTATPTSGQPVPPKTPYTGSLFTIKQPTSANTGLLTQNVQSPTTSQSSASFAPVGVRATSPMTTIKPPANTLASQYQAAPTQPTPISSQSSSIGGPTDASANQALLAAQNQREASANNQSNNSNNPNSSNNSSNNGLYGQLITGLANKASQPSTDYTAQQNQANQYNEALKESRINEAQGLAANAMNPIPLEFQQGRAQVMQNQYAQEQAALGSAFQGASTLQGAANTQQGLQQSGLASAANLAQPVGQFGMLTNPVTGQPINTQILGSVVSQAQHLVNRGVPVTDPSVQNLLNPLGLFGASAFTQAQQMLSGGNWNPAAQAAGAGQNLAFQTQTQGMSQNLGLGLQQLDALQPKILDFLNSSPLNPSGIPIANEQISKYLSEIKNPGLTTQWNSIMNDIQTVAQQIISSKSPGTPTSTTEMAAAQNPSSLTGSQLKAVLDTWNNLGKTTLGVYQNANQQAGGSGNAYLGGSSQTNPTITQSSSNQKGFTNPVYQGIGGAILNLGNWAQNEISTLGSKVVGAITL